MAGNEHSAERSDDADVRGEHEYKRDTAERPQGKDIITVESASARRSYAAGENGTQQVATPPTADKDDRER